jgi:hypothetical protein
VAKFEPGMRFAYVIQSRRVRAWVVLIALAIMVILIATVFLQSRRSPKPFEMDDLYGLLD